MKSASLQKYLSWVISSSCHVWCSKRVQYIMNVISGGIMSSGGHRLFPIGPSSVPIPQNKQLTIKLSNIGNNKIIYTDQRECIVVSNKSNHNNSIRLNSSNITTLHSDLHYTRIQCVFTMCTLYTFTIDSTDHGWLHKEGQIPKENIGVLTIKMFFCMSSHTNCHLPNK